MAKPGPLPPLARLKEVLDFDPVNLFTWKVNRGKGRIGDVAGCLNVNGYWRIMVDGKRYLRSRLVWLWFTGEDPGDMQVDHANNIRTDDRFSNLQLLIEADNRKKISSARTTPAATQACAGTNATKNGKP